MPARHGTARHGTARHGTRSAEISSRDEHYQIRRSRHPYSISRAVPQPCRAVEKISVRNKDDTRARSGANF